ncbi:MAG: hypothetical protein FJY75_10570, partial [Candidatus Eisenbacteria bacterium]|nr:hypothetical protein [Candidatus Eisenbacteria bacterium]
AQLMIKQARHDDAEALLEQGRQLEPLHGGLWIARGDLAGLRGDHAAALAAYRKAEEIDPYRVALAARARIQQTEAKLAGRASPR